MSIPTYSVPAGHEHLALLGEGGQGTVSKVRRISDGKVSLLALRSLLLPSPIPDPTSVTDPSHEDRQMPQEIPHQRSETRIVRSP